MKSGEAARSDTARARAGGNSHRADVRAWLVSARGAGRDQLDGGADGGATKILTTDGHAQFNLISTRLQLGVSVRA